MIVIAFLTKGQALRQALEYDHSPCKITGKQRAEYICGTLQGTPRQMSKQAAPLRALRDVTNPIWRVSLNLDTRDGILSPKKWDEISNDFLIGMGLNPVMAAWCSIRHSDHHDDPVPRDGVHISVLRVQPDGTLFNIENDVFRAIKVTKQLEEKYGLHSHSRERAERRAPTNAQIRATKRTGKMASKMKIQKYVDEIFEQEKNDLTYEILREKLLFKGVEIRASQTQKGRLQGFSFLDQKSGVAVPGSKLGSDYSLGMLTRGLKYDQKEEIGVAKPASKMPAMLKPMILPAQYGAKEIRPHAAHQTEVSIDTEKFNNQVTSLQIGPASKVMLLIGGLLAQASVFLIQKILAFLKRLLAAFGFGMRQSDLQKYEHADPTAPALCYEPAQLALPAPKSAEDKVAEELFRVVESLEKNDPDLLPVIEGEEIEKARAEVVAAMTKKSDTNPAASTTAEVENLDFLSDDFSTEPTQKQTESPPQSQVQAAADALAQLKTSIADLVAANKDRDAAERDRPGMYVYFDTRDDRKADLTKINNWLDESKTKFAEWKAKNKFKFLVGSSQKDELEGEIFHLENLKKAAEEELKKANEAEEKAEKFYRTLPAGVVPPDIFNRINRAAAEIRIARKLLQDEAETLLNQLKADPMLGRQMAEIKRSVESNFKNYLTVGVVSAGDFKSLSNQILELRRLKVTQENARNAALAEHESEKDKPAIDGQIVK
jgi:Relaxase/Mobilisation nuclease domain